MTTRRALLLAAAATAAGCSARRSVPASTPAGAGDLLIVETGTGLLAAVDAQSGQPVVAPTTAVLGADGARLIRTEPAGADTRLTAVRLPDGGRLFDQLLTGDLGVRAVSADHRLVALAGSPGHDPYRPVPRERSTIVVADGQRERFRAELPGNLEPEAFALTGDVLFVLDHRPATAPQAYRVRVLDLATGRLEPLLTRLKTAVPAGAEEEMRGQGRQAVYDPGRRLLFTLYTHQPEHLHTRDLVRGARAGAGHVHAFVHTLNLTERWAYCIDLPTPFGEHPPAGHALALDPDGSRLRVVDTTSGQVATIDPDALTVTDTAPALPAVAGGAAATVAADGRLVVGAGRQVAVAGRLRPEAAWATGGPVRGLALGADPRHVYVGTDAAVVRHDLATGRELHRVQVPGLVAVRTAVRRT